MSARDLSWRACGLALFASACLVSQADLMNVGPAAGSSGDATLGLLCFLGAIAGIVLAVQGERLPVSWRAERRGHHLAIPAARLAGRRRSGPLRRS